MLYRGLVSSETLCFFGGSPASLLQVLCGKKDDLPFGRREGPAVSHCQLLSPSCRTLVMGYRAGPAPIVSALLGVLAGPLICDKSCMSMNTMDSFGTVEMDGAGPMAGGSSTKHCTVFRLKLLFNFSTVVQWQAACFQIS